MIKLIGGFFICAAGGILTLSLCRFHRKRLETLDGLISLIYYIKGQVDCYARPISGILSTMSPEILRDCNCPEGAMSLEEIVDESRIFLDRDTFRLLTTFAAEFGSTFREEQTRRCEHYIAVLRDRRAIVADRLSAEMRSHSAVCICVALCLMILLW